MQLEGKNALVTGAGRGIGRAISLALAEKKANVAIHYYRKAEEAEKTLADAEKRGVIAALFQANVSDSVDAGKLIQAVTDRLGGVDILINNAGISGPHSTLSQITDSEWRDVLDVNLTGAFFCCQAAEAELRRNGGKIVNISSIAGKMGGTIGCHYAASKAGLIGLTFALARELAPDVTVNAVAPGPVDTDFISADIKEKLSLLAPLGRIACPEEIAHAVIFLLENDYVSGEVVDINAGRHMD
jgi:3-oxoacyl-[acyl-carrier protein] reductase